MKKLLVFLLTAVALPLAAAEPEKLETTEQIVSYGIGMQIARSLMEQDVTIVDIDVIALAIDDIMSGREPRISSDRLQEAQGEYRQLIAQKQQQQAQEAKAAGEAFLAENRDREGVVELDSGLQYKELVKGNGESPTNTDTVRVHYRGMLLDGEEFDSSYKRNQPAEFPVSNVIAGWQQALLRMSVGSKWHLWIPAELAYGSTGAGPKIGPNATLQFEVELLEIKR